MRPRRRGSSNSTWSGKSEQAEGRRPGPEPRIGEVREEVPRFVESQIADAVNAIWFAGARTECNVMVPVRVQARLRLDVTVIDFMDQRLAVLVEPDVEVRAGTCIVCATGEGEICQIAIIGPTGPGRHRILVRIEDNGLFRACEHFNGICMEKPGEQGRRQQAILG